MSLASLTDVKRILRAAPPQGYPRIKIGTSGTDDLTEVDATSFLDAQEAYIISRIGFTVSASDALMKEVHANLTAFQIYIHMLSISPGGEIPEFVRAWIDWAENILDEIVKGKIKVTRPQADALPLLARSSFFKQMLWEKVTLKKTNEWATLSEIRVIPYTEKVHSTEEGGTEYVRNTDYEISYKTGELRRLSAGGIAEDAEIYIDYFYIEQKDFWDAPASVAWDSARRDKYRS